MPILGNFCLEQMLNQINYQYHSHNQEHPDKPEWPCSRLWEWKQFLTPLCIHFFSERLSVQFSSSVVSDSLQTHELQHTRPACPSPTPGVYPNSYPLSWWCHPTISSSVVPFSSCLQSYPESGSFQRSQLFTSGGQNIGVPASASVLPMNTQSIL